MNPHRRLLLIIALVVMIAATVLANAPSLYNFQGRLTNALGTPVADGTYNVHFTLYDASTSGSVIWSETDNITTHDGLFSSTIACIPSHLDDTALYLGIRVGTDPEMTPRTRITSVPYALSARSIRRTNNDGTARYLLKDYNSYSEFKLNDTSGQTRARLAAFEGTGGLLYLYRDDPGQKMIFAAQENSGHANVMMHNAQGTMKVFLDADSVGDGAAKLPDSSISKTEICDEPGLAFSHNTSTVTLTGSPADIVTASFTAPANGYVLVTAKATAYLSGTTGINYGYAQIDNSSGGTIQNPYRAVFGANAMGSTAAQFIPFTVTRVFAVTAGANSIYRLESCYGGAQGAGAVIDIHDAMIQVAYFPSLYGTAITLVSGDEVSQFDNAVPVEMDGEITYEVDLRELELKAARERAKAEQAEAALERARRKEAEKQLQELSGK